MVKHAIIVRHRKERSLDGSFGTASGGLPVLSNTLPFSRGCCAAMMVVPAKNRRAATGGGGCLSHDVGPPHPSTVPATVPHLATSHLRVLVRLPDRCEDRAEAGHSPSGCTERLRWTGKNARGKKKTCGTEKVCKRKRKREREREIEERNHFLFPLHVETSALLSRAGAPVSAAPSKNPPRRPTTVPSHSCANAD